MLDADPLFRFQPAVETRWATAENPTGGKGRGGTANGGRKGSASFPLAPGEQRILAQADGASGTVRRMWMTISDRSPQMLRSLRLEAFWDDAGEPAISAPIGDFFGIGLGRMAAFASAAFSSPEGRSFMCCLPMPFRRAMRIVITNDGATPLEHLYYDIAYTLGDRHDDRSLWFHAHWRRERRTRMQRDYEILPLVLGRGRYLGANIGVIADQQRYFRSWWGEGECKIHLDGDREWPTLCGTGAEDYVGTAWELGRFDHPYQGCPVADHDRLRFCFYRYHIPDPVWFQREARVSMQQIGNYGPEAKAQFLATGRAYPVADPHRAPLRPDSPDHGLLEREDDWSSCAYLYLDRASSGLPPLAAVAERVEGLA